MEERKVKGAMILDLVKMIRKSPGRGWEMYLTPADMQIVNGRVIPLSWYPLGVMQRCGLAVFKELAGGDLETVRQAGKARGLELFAGTYRGIFEKTDCLGALDSYVVIHNTMFSFPSLRLERLGRGRARLHHDYDARDPANVPYCHQLLGTLDALLEVTGGREAMIVMSARQWEGAPATVFELTWSEAGRSGTG
ncbi:MAG TPA: hypothetical protein PK668_28055 [Myxococcota bacterium]|nr:hypothetical protein [Myxococcota bacterium]HRY97352.1 hypothetical protein [Myxococcota bacterium]